MDDQEAQIEPLHPEKLTWAVLLGRWVDLAKSALALPRDQAGQRLRESVPDLIMLQAVTHALQDVRQLDEAERALALDRAGVLIEKHEAALRTRWGSEPMHAGIEELISDARAALRGQA